jgi:hypothetical protein
VLKKTPILIKEALNSLPTSLDAAYDEVMGRMKEQERKAAAFHVMSWVFNAGRSLRMNELCEALVIQEGNRVIDEESIQSSDNIIEMCESLVVCDQSTKVVTFAHYTVKEYLGSSCGSQLLPAASLAKKCLTYLASDVFENPLPEDEDEFREWLNKHPFSSYAVNFWTSIDDDPDVQGLLFATIGSPTKRRDFARIQDVDNWWVNVRMSEPFLHILVRAELEKICEAFVDNMQVYHPT